MSVALIFPPIINSGFGAYYPAMPVLAGYLICNGVQVAQVDLNEQLAVQLLKPECLAVMGRGEFPGWSDPSSPTAAEADTRQMAAVAARLLKKNRDKLFDHKGRHRFGDRDETPAYLLAILAQPFLVDQPLDLTLADIAADSPLAWWYRDFYLQSDLRGRLEDDVTLIGVSVPMGPQLFPALILAGVLKDLRPNARVVFGGPTLSLMQEASIELLLRDSRSVDAVVRFEGEAPLLALTRQAESGVWAPERVEGVSCVAPEGALHRAPGSGAPLDKLPFAHYDAALLSQLDNPEFGVVQTRGCYWGRCAYCDFVQLYDGSLRYRGRSAASFVDEVEALVRTRGGRRFSLITEAIPPSFALKFSQLVVQRGLKIAWSSFAMIDRHFTRQHFDAMADSGCEHLVVGLETMTDRVLNLVQKYATGDDNEWFVREAHSAGIRIVINLIPDLPTTTYQEALSCLHRLEGLSETLGGVAIFPFEATRSSLVGRTPERFGLSVAPGGASGQAAFAENHLHIVDAGMSDEERGEIHGLFRAFADRINSRAQRGRHQVGPATGRLKLASSDFDVINTGDRIRIFNWKTRARWEAPIGYKRIIERAEALGPSFSKEQLVDCAEQKAALGLLIDRLVEKSIFIPAPEDSTPEVSNEPSRHDDVVLLDR